MSKLDYHNGKTVTDSSFDGIVFDGGAKIPGDRLLADPPNEIVGTTQLKVEQNKDVAHITFGHARQDAAGKAIDPLVIAIVEAVGDDLAP